MNIRDGKGAELFVFFLGFHELARNLFFFCPVCAPTRVHGPPGNTTHHRTDTHVLATRPPTRAQRPAGRHDANPRKAQVRPKYRIHQHGTFVDVELKPPSTGILYVALSDSIRTVRAWTQASTRQNDACPTRSWTHWLHSFLSGSGSLAARRSGACPHRGHANPDGWPTPKHQLAYPSVGVLSGAVSLVAKVLFWLS